MTQFKLVSAAAIAAALTLTACATENSETAAPAGSDGSFIVTGSDGVKLKATPLEFFDNPWAMTFLPDGRAVVTEQAGDIWLVGTDGSNAGEITGGPDVMMRGQGGLGDIILHPAFAETGEVYLSYVERDDDDDSLSGAAVEIATLSLTEDGGTISDRKVIWRQNPKVKDNGHYGHRMAVSPDGYLFITSGERQKFTPAQDMSGNLGKVVRLNLDGSVPEDNPFADQGGVAAEVWTLGHRNPLGIDFDNTGRLWVQEMGPAHGDELNLIVAGENYGYPEVSNGDHYDGRPIPDHDTRPEFAAPAAYWVPAISPAGLDIYYGGVFPDWNGNAFIGGLSSKALIRVELEEEGGGAAEGGRYSWDKRIREVEEGPDGAIYVLEDEEGGRLIRLTPAE
ncbi:dehydrogenase, glucose/sorbosone family [Hyphomonas neptunium ATCC 15444]|uniref:Dehydrogenase, glucose/sorbosone family n=2 Tax=Hyphomonas TaxID=85 RepID=Q0BYH6_HYPNA|nr:MULTISPECIES: PQQ-dependent sugar dehydrogenase [Hyphomonas]ABI77903.1 dehydrogenase, glucose/sorbosone family [Hyphomonas neptunium ATCC 15444]KCZ87061.1 glucose/sorbosone family dehydrogenase [Hyphomonas hirschiana VP5]